MDKFNNIEYLRVYTGKTKGENPVVTWTGQEVNGLTRNELAHKIAEYIGREGKVTYTYKMPGEKWKVSNLIAFFEPGDKREKQETRGMDHTEIKKQYEEIYTLKASLKDEEINYLKNKISLLTAEIEDLKKQLETEGENPGGLVNFFTMLSTQAMQTKTLKAEHREPVSGTIPGEIINVLNTIDYARLTPEKVKELAGKLQNAITFFNLPKKQ
ncbi:MAG: hypothetical protein L6Q47_02235 [Ignavibacteriaceae bacterium]|nr:hypothetical protein [Ignavibacteriaceae bacterium]